MNETLKHYNAPPLVPGKPINTGGDNPTPPGEKEDNN